MTNCRRGRRALFAIVLLLAGVSTAAASPDWSVRWHSAARTTEFRGVELDSIPVADAVADAEGRLFTPDGYAVRCPAGSAWCYFYRAGDVERSSPITSELDVSAWRLGVPGLRAKVSARAAGDPGDTAVWPGTDPAFRLREGYLEWAHEFVEIRGGRQFDPGRFGFIQWDGGRLRVQGWNGRASAAVYGGLGLARGTSLSATDPALDVLDEFRPADRQRVLGFEAAGVLPCANVRAQYLREIDPRAEDFVTERFGAEFDTRVGPVTVNAGSDWDLAFGEWGTAEIDATWRAHHLAAVSAGARRYRPFFDLWTVWGAFSPVPYKATHASLALGPWRTLTAHGRFEHWTWDDTGTTIPLVVTEDDGKRFEGRLAWRPDDRWTVTGGLQRVENAGASIWGGDGSVGYRPAETLDLSLDFGRWDRPIELRYDDAELTTWGGSVRWSAAPAVRFDLALRHLDEVRDRPDASRVDWGTWNASLGLTVQLDSDRTRGVPPAVLRIPERQVPR
ncbi:MAG: hypothetical protein KC591_01385 [Gemmatimonadetes bacterium]|nr:hypothetical protein [Gemmatimonadota bacterium]